MAARVPPQNIDAERQVLGSMLIDGRQEAIAVAVEILTADDFYLSSHQKIFQSIINLFEQSSPIDLVTVSEELRSNSHLEAAGGIAYLTELIRDTVAGVDIEYHARLVYAKSILRQLIIIAEDIRERSFRDTEEVQTLIDDFEVKIFTMSQRTNRKPFIEIKELVKEGMREIETRYKQKGTLEGITGIPTGFTYFDEMTAGLHRGEYIIIAARPSVGKTAFALNIAQHLAIHKGVGVGIFSFEMTNENIFERLISAEARVDAQKIRKGYINNHDWKKLTYASHALMEAPIYLNDEPSLSAMDIRARARRLLSIEPRIQLIVIDYLQLIKSHARIENRQQEVTEISRLLKALAKDLKIPVIAVSQLSRAPEKRPDPRPVLSDLRESGAIEQDADMVVFIHRPGYHKRGSGQDEEVDTTDAELIIAKQRNGPVGNVHLRFIDKYVRFENPYVGEEPAEVTGEEAGVSENSGVDFA